MRTQLAASPGWPFVAVACPATARRIKPRAIMSAPDSPPAKRAFISHSGPDDRYVAEFVQLVRSLGFAEPERFSPRKTRKTRKAVGAGL